MDQDDPVTKNRDSDHQERKVAFFESKEAEVDPNGPDPIINLLVQERFIIKKYLSSGQFGMTYEAHDT